MNRQEMIDRCIELIRGGCVRGYMSYFFNDLVLRNDMDLLLDSLCSISEQYGDKMSREVTLNTFGEELVRLSVGLCGSSLEESVNVSGKMSLGAIAKKHGVNVGELNKELVRGIRVVLEHTDSIWIARRIALDHLFELPDYYTRLSRMEKGGLKETDTYSSYKVLDRYKKRKEEFINSIKSFDDINIDKIRQCVDYFGYEGFNDEEDEEDAIEYLKDAIEYYKEMPNPVVLYRIIGVKNKKDIKFDEPGEHYTPHEWNLNSDTLLSIGYENWDSDIKPYVMQVSVPHSEIDVIRTIIQNLAFPNEHEINLKNNGKGIKFIKAYKLKGY